MKKIFLLIAALAATATAYARTLHYGDGSVELTDEYKTAPALHVQFSEEEMVYGALYNIDDLLPPDESLRIGYNNKEYWAGSWCPWWQYIPAGTNECTDIPMEMYNRYLTMEEAKQYNIPSDINAWELISACGNTASTGACAIGTLQPGKYFIFDRYSSIGTHAQIALFDHPVGYKSQHSGNYFETTIDTENEVYQKATLPQVSGAYASSWSTNINAANISNRPTTTNLYIYRMK